MNMRILLVGALAFVGAVGVAQADTVQVQPVPYHYGMPLNVAKVVSMTEPATPECKVITADMTFIDKAGKLEAISYRKLSDACSYQN
ncbi:MULTISPECIES: DUF2790 domain-containing protein [Pseudomonas]|uniref:DUF2790 domain-containing protein n=1 Tax=Pseudomonas TaxID=286 RepID=UPI000C88DCF7|nr:MULTISPECIES: DUF2790 domain-containing protein [Pseudomonas]AVO59091.1 DUF2790 domain-containing protein [Pseudomonas chlororaphis subsp. piscium]PMY39157.1 DUF2790 domain-containing protein [Pseudomonas sp. FW306-2-2C-D06C]PYC38450.1 DUF2790 domain-containing protein [Pseudomonas chlororaphis]